MSVIFYYTVIGFRNSLIYKRVLMGLWTVHSKRGVWRCHSVNQRTDNTMPKETRQKGKQWSTKHYTKDRVIRTQLKLGNEHRCPGRVGSPWSTSGTCRISNNTGIKYEWGKDRRVFMTSGTYPWSFVTHIFRNE